MFTGLINHLGRFRGFRLGEREMLVEAPKALVSAVKEGDSLAVNGVCLTVTGIRADRLTFTVSRETIEKTTLGKLTSGDVLNLELPLTLSTPLGGHLVSGHVDTVGKVLRITDRPPGKRLAVSIGREHIKFIVSKGSVAVNGVSLTVAGLEKDSFEIELLPLTLRSTNLGGLSVGSPVNVECDMIGKYVYNYVLPADRKN